MIPSDGELREPRPIEFEDFYRTLIVGDERGVSSATATSLQFPSAHYFALFIAMCLTAREKVGALSASDFAILRRALYNDHTFRIEAIIACRLHLNRTKGKIHGSIYATRLASHFNVQIRQHDYPLPKVYLDHQAMVAHQFTNDVDYLNNIRYNLQCGFL